MTMFNAIHALRTRFRRSPSRAATPTPGSTPAGEAEVNLRGKAAALRDAIDWALNAGALDQARRLAASGARLTTQYPPLLESIARVHMAGHDPAAALVAIDALVMFPPGIRLLRIAALLQLGRRADAHSDLLAWSRRRSAPPIVHQTLALLEASTGDHHAAANVLLRSITDVDHAAAIEQLLLYATERERDELASRWAQRLRDTAPLTADPQTLDQTDLLLQSLGQSPTDRATLPTGRQVAQLANELPSAEGIIPALVATQDIEHDPAMMTLLSSAIEQSLEQLRDRGTACDALARLAMMRHEYTLARTWAQRGLIEAPLSAALRSTLRRAEDALARSRDTSAGTDVAGRIGPDEIQEQAA